MLTMVKATELPLPEPVFGELIKLHNYNGDAFAMTPFELEGEREQLLSGKSGRIYTACSECVNGYKAHYAGIHGGVCFQCNGSVLKLYAESIEKAQRKARSKTAAGMRQAAKWAAEAPAREAAAAAAKQKMLDEAHARALEELTRMDALEAKQASQRFAGTIGGKVTVTGTVAVSMLIEGHYGSSCLVIVEGTGDDTGITLKSFGTSAWHWDTEKGEAVTVTATVKDHEVYDGTKQTVVIRPKATA